MPTPTPTPTPNDAQPQPATAHDITRVGLARVGGQHLSQAPNEERFSEEQLLAADLAYLLNQEARERRRISECTQWERAMDSRREWR